jgi:tetratricopeptide (TPR) repeat protein
LACKHANLVLGSAYFIQPVTSHYGYFEFSDNALASWSALLIISVRGLTDLPRARAARRRLTMSMTLNFFEHSFNRGRRLQEAGRSKEAARLFDRLGLLTNAPDEIASEALTSLGQMLLEQGEVEAARQSTQEACRRDPCAAEAQFAHAQACLEGDDADLEQALGAFLLAVEIEPDVARYHAELGKVQIALDMELEGLQSLEHAVELEPESPAMLRDLIDSLMDLGQEAEAFKRAKAALFMAPRIQGFRALWNDLCFCRAADEIALAEEAALKLAPKLRCRILPFAQNQSPGRTSQVGRRRVRHDGATETASPHFPRLSPKTDRRRA